MVSKANQAIKYAYNKGYRVNNNGDVVNPSNKIIQAYIRKDNYKVIRIRTDKLLGYRSKYAIVVHRLAAFQRFGEKLFGDGIVVRHLNGDEQDNSINNLKLGTRSDDAMDKTKEARREGGIKASYTTRRFIDKDVANIRQDRESGMTYKELCTKYNTSKSTLSYLFNHALY